MSISVPGRTWISPTDVKMKVYCSGFCCASAAKSLNGRFWIHWVFVLFYISIIRTDSTTKSARFGVDLWRRTIRSIYVPCAGNPNRDECLKGMSSYRIENNIYGNTVSPQCNFRSWPQRGHYSPVSPSKSFHHGWKKTHGWDHGRWLLPCRNDTVRPFLYGVKNSMNSASYCFQWEHAA